MKVNKFFIILFAFLMQGCRIFESNLVNEMDKAYSIFDEKIHDRKLINDNEKKRNEKISQVVKKHFPVGSSSLYALSEIKKYGFVIYEYNKKGFRNYNKRNFKKYPNDISRKSSIVGLKNNDVRFIATRIYWRNLSDLFMTGKEAYIVIDVDNEKIIAVDGRVFIQGI
jgi:hypothetical protein